MWNSLPKDTPIKIKSNISGIEVKDAELVIDNNGEFHTVRHFNWDGSLNHADFYGYEDGRVVHKRVYYPQTSHPVN